MQQKYLKKEPKKVEASKPRKKIDKQPLVLGKRKIKPRVRLGEEPSDQDEENDTRIQSQTTERSPSTRGRGRGRGRGNGNLTPQKRRKIEKVPQLSQPELHSQTSSKSNVDHSQDQDSREGSDDEKMAVTNEEIEEEGEAEMEEASEQGESEMEEGEEQEDEEVSQSQAELNQEPGSELSGCQSSSEDDGIDREANLKAWKSLLIRDGVGPFLNPKRLVEKVQFAMVKHGLTDAAEPKNYAEALGQLMDSTEFYMRGLITKVIKSSRMRMQEQHPNMSLARAGDQNEFQTVSY